MCDFLNIDRQHFNEIHKLIDAKFETEQSDQNIFLKKINIKINDFFKFTDNHFYKELTDSSFKMYKKTLLNNGKHVDINDINVLEDYVENNSKIDNFSKNFCRFILKILYPDLDVSTIGDLLSLVIDDVNLFYNLYVKQIYEIYLIQSLLCFEKKIKVIDFNECLQRTPDNHVSFQSGDGSFILNFVIP